MRFLRSSYMGGWGREKRRVWANARKSGWPRRPGCLWPRLNAAGLVEVVFVPCCALKQSPRLSTARTIKAKSSVAQPSGKHTKNKPNSFDIQRKRCSVSLQKERWLLHVCKTRRHMHSYGCSSRVPTTHSQNLTSRNGANPLPEQGR